ncbi:hypothetical protein, partial [Nocardioides stalactiti]|uniref:hypothetical protein n=1 Tax=Nocardioides stalactiti TaxID=2755356 RepID=UPI001600FD16
ALAIGLAAGAPVAAAEPVDPGGRPVEGSTDEGAPTPLDAGLWTSTLGLQTQPQYFSYERQIEGSTVHVGVVALPRTPDYDGFTIATTVPSADEPEGVDCGTGDASSDSSFYDAPIGDEVLVGDEDSAEDPCRTAGTITVRIERYSTSSIEQLPIAIKVVEEAPVTDPGTPLADDAELAYDVPEPADPVDGPRGATAFDDAPLVDTSGGPVTLATDITEGSTLLWRVALDWGDQVVVRGDLPAVPADGPLATGSVSVQVRLVQPSRDVFALSHGEDYYYGDFGVEKVSIVAASHPLRFDNRYRDLEPTLPGDYWVAVSVERAQDREPVPAPIDLTFDVTRAEGADEDGPTYKDAVLAQGGGAGPGGYSARTPYLVGVGDFSAVASGSPVGAPDDEAGWWGPRRGLGIGLGVVSLACCVSAGLWLRRRRSA